jgi:hypothetical protein
MMRELTPANAGLAEFIIGVSAWVLNCCSCLMSHWDLAYVAFPPRFMCANFHLTAVSSKIIAFKQGKKGKRGRTVVKFLWLFAGRTAS